MKFMNEYDLMDAQRHCTQQNLPNRLALVLTVDRLRNWTDEHSDGWAYWRKPVQAAARAIELIEGRPTVDITEKQMQAAVVSIKAFLTRQSKLTDYRGRPMVTEGQRELILRATQLSFRETWR